MTLHKCASTLFGHYLLPNVPGLIHVDYERQFFDGCSVNEVTFQPHGYIYGPIRLSSGYDQPVYRRVVEPVTNSDFIRHRIVILFIRDPRDVLVSQYYSFGFSHPLSKSGKIRNQQLAFRESVQQQTVDEYVTERAFVTARHFDDVYRLSQICKRNVVLRYEDMIHDFSAFSRSLQQYIKVSQTILNAIYKHSRPKDKEDKSSHRRSGKVGGYRDKLQPETVETLNRQLEQALNRFGYNI